METKQATQARKTLIIMIDSIPSDHILIVFIKESIFTPFRLNASVSDNKLLPNNSQPWVNIDKSNFSNKEGGTYLFHQSLNNTQYLGSAANFSDRIQLHEMQFRPNSGLARSLHKQELNNQSTLFFSTIHIVPSYLNLFRLKYPNYLLTQGQYEILLALTLYPVRVLEQSLISQFNPLINGEGGRYDLTVYHRFTTWDSSRLNLERLIRGAIPVNIFNLDGSLEFQAVSSTEASKYLDMSIRSVPLYLNNAKPFFSTTLGKFVFLRSPGFEGQAEYRKIEAQIKFVSELILPNVKLSDLSPLFIYVFNEAKETFVTYFTLTGVYRGLFPIKYEDYIKNNKLPQGVLNSIRARINKDLPVIAENGMKYYIAKNPERVENKFRDNSII